MVFDPDLSPSSPPPLFSFSGRFNKQSAHNTHRWGEGLECRTQKETSDWATWRLSDLVNKQDQKLIYGSVTNRWSIIAYCRIFPLKKADR